MKYSKNKKLNTVLTAIENDIIYHFDENKDLMISELTRYKREFPRETDHNFAQYGNLLCYCDQIYKFYRAAGYKSTDKLSVDKIWEIYKRQVAYVIREILTAGDKA